MKRWATVYLSGLALVALLAGLLTNDRPLVAGVEGAVTFPVFGGMPETRDWSATEMEWAIWPPIRYRAGRLGEERGENLLPPLSPGSDGGRHWLGTDSVGRDLAAGLVAGSRVAVVVGLGSLIIALTIGLPLGAVAGYFGNDGLRLPLGPVIGMVTAVLVGAVYLFASLGVALPAWGAIPLGMGLIALLGWTLGRVLGWIPVLRTRVAVPLDRVVMTLLELFGSIPGLVFLLALLTYLGRPGLLTVVVVIGLLGWTAIARFLRAELLRIRELPYIRAARVGGVGELRILTHHALPNALAPVAVTAAFLVGGSVLLESMLSFLGIGVPADQVSWGSILQESRSHPTAWWLAVFPGVLLSLTVLACNSLRRR
jgi:peptide/nickel transport system permease protein